MSELPDVSEVLDRMFGPQYRVDLRRTLLEKADQTDDVAYAERLREAADGRRPLRSLGADPSFQAAIGLDEVDRGEVEARSITPEEREDLARQLEQHREEHGTPAFPPFDELATYAAAALARAERTRDVIAMDESTGWQGSDEHLAQRRSTSADAEDGPAAERDRD